MKDLSERESSCKVLGVTPIYPSEAHPESGTFVHALFEAMGNIGAEVEVIAPYSFTRKLIDLVYQKKRSLPGAEKYPAIIRHGYWGVSSRLLPWRNMGNRISFQNFRRAVWRSFPENVKKNDFVHAYFLQAGWACIDLCERHEIPCIIELSESDLPNSYNGILGPGELEDTLRRFAGIIAVSKENETFCRIRCPEIADRIIYLPNSVHTDKFSPCGRANARQKLGLSNSYPIGVFCGHFVERKGPRRVLEALKLLSNVKGVFLGAGLQMPSGPEVLYAGAVENSLIPLWLSASDVFVLPSLAEGMSFAIVEALACGLPVVVSDRPFNRSFLNEECAVFVDPLDPHSIAEGIRFVLTDSSRRKVMSEASLKLSQSFSLRERANAVLEFAHKIRSNGRSARYH
jgi:teichuronic acid biosynthesis glycosyltransferase TuaC